MKYVAFFKKSFGRNMIYRFDYILGLLNSCLQIYISCVIWKALYNYNDNNVNISYAIIVTNFIISLGLTNAYSIDDLVVQKEIWDGSITNELLKPLNFRLQLLAQTMGNVVFKLIFNFFPTVAVMILIFSNDFIFCNNVEAFILTLVSVGLGFLVLWELSSIVQMLCFWFVNVWSISTIKNVFVSVLTGSMLPMWFLPDAVRVVVAWTPFQAIYYIPIEIYLGNIQSLQIAQSLLLQCVWILILGLIGNMLWIFGKRKLVVQGG